MNLTIFETQKGISSTFHWNIVSSIVFDFLKLHTPCGQLFGFALISELESCEDYELLVVMIGQDPRIGFNSIEIEAAIYGPRLAFCFQDWEKFTVFSLGTD